MLFGRVAKAALRLMSVLVGKPVTIGVASTRGKFRPTKVKTFSGLDGEAVNADLYCFHSRRPHSKVRVLSSIGYLFWQGINVCGFVEWRRGRVIDPYLDCARFRVFTPRLVQSL